MEVISELCFQKLPKILLQIKLLQNNIYPFIFIFYIPEQNTDELSHEV